MAQVLCHLPKFSDPNLLVGFESSDDAAVYRINDELALIQTVDIFPPVVDDPYEYGLIAAANSISDVYAMGGLPKLAMNVFCFPEDLPKDVLHAILQGGYEKVQEADALIVGGHTIKDVEPKYGLCVSGFIHPSKIWYNNTAKPGDILILTKALGTGILTTAAKGDMLSAMEHKAMVDSMSTLNKLSAKIARTFPINACTDITGFGILGHCLEVAVGSQCTITLDSGALPLLPGTLDYAKMGIIPAATYQNRASVEDLVNLKPTLPLELSDILFDPQTSGGLLFSLPEKEGQQLLRELNASIPVAKIIGHVEAFHDWSIFVK